MGKTRIISVAIVVGLATVVWASLAWACVGSNTPLGTPDTPAAAPTPAEPAPSGSPAPTESVAPPAVAIGVNSLEGTSGANSTSGALAPSRATGGAPNRAQSPINRGAGSVRADTGAASEAFARRLRGDTVGTTSRNGQAVYARSAPAKRKPSAKEPARPSPRSATGDLWAGFKPGARSSVFAAQASAAQQGDGVLNGTVAAALGLLGIGLAGIAGGATFFALRGRRAKSRSAADGSGTDRM